MTTEVKGGLWRGYWVLCMTWAQPGTRAQEPVPQQWESSFCLGLDGKSSSNCRAEQQRKALSRGALERTYWKSTWSQSEPKFHFLHSKVVWLGIAKILPTLRFKQRLEDAGGQGEEILFVANQMMDYVSLWTKPGTANSPSSFQSWGRVGVCCVVASLDDFSTGLLQTHHGEVFPWRTLPSTERGQERWGGQLGVSVSVWCQQPGENSESSSLSA